MGRPHRILVTGAVLAVLGLASCHHSLTTGKVGNPVDRPGPSSDCLAGKSPCGSGVFSRCVDLQTDADNCGACGRACTTGIACVAGECQQPSCPGPVLLSPAGQPTDTFQFPIGLQDKPQLADVNGDGRMDLVTLLHIPTEQLGTFLVGLGQPGGGFGPPTTYRAISRAQEITVGDYNGDGMDDLFVAASFGDPCVQVWLGHADGVLTTAPTTRVQGCLNTVSVADLDGDGTTDLVTPYELGGLRVFLADADRTLQTSTWYPTKRQVMKTYLLDWNGDGSPDIVAIGHTLSLYFNNGDGTFQDAIECALAMPWPDKVRVEDFNHDSHPDVVAATDSTIAVMLNQGECQFLPALEYPCDAPVYGITLGDLDGDGQPDVVAGLENNRLALLRGNPDGTFRLEFVDQATSTAGWVLVGEVTGDGKPDILTSGRQGTTQIWGNTCQ